VRDLTEAELIDIERDAYRLAKWTSEYNNDGTREAMNKGGRQDAREAISELAARISNHVDALCAHNRRMPK
jgi:hypothetical protein